MKWTTDKPSEPGWYWYRRPEKTNIIEVAYSKRKKTMVLTYVDFPVAKLDPGQFSGPIPEPEE